jgi:hypothetical protein
MKGAKMNRWLPSIAILSCLAGCSSGAAMGNPKARLAIERNALPQRGHTIDQITTSLGSPNRVAPGADGHADHIEYQYIYAHTLNRHPGLIWIPLVGLAFTQADMAWWQLDVVFDKHGRVTDVRTMEIVGVAAH